MRSDLMEQLIVMGSRNATRFRHQPYRLVLASVMEEMGSEISELLDRHDRKVRETVLATYSIQEATKLLMEIE